MELLTPKLIARFKKVGSQSNDPNPLVICKFFDPMGTAQWFATAHQANDNTCFGYVKDLVPDVGGICDEWGYFSIEELEAVQRPFGLTIERDILLEEKRIYELVPELNRQY